MNTSAGPIIKGMAESFKAKQVESLKLELCEAKELIKDQRAFIEELKASKKTLSSKLITQQEETQGPLQFLDALENLLLDHGFKVVSVDE